MLYISRESFLEHPCHKSVLLLLEKYRVQHPNGPDIFIELPFIRSNQRSIHHLDKSLLFVVAYSPKSKHLLYGLGRLYNKNHIFQYSDGYSYDALFPKHIYHTYDHHIFSVENGGFDEVPFDVLKFAPFNSYRLIKKHENHTILDAALFEKRYFEMLSRLHYTFSETCYTTPGLLDTFLRTNHHLLKEILPSPRLFL